MFIKYRLIKSSTGEIEQITGICEVKDLILDKNTIRAYAGRSDPLGIAFPFDNKETAVQALNAISCALELKRNLCDISIYQ